MNEATLLSKEPVFHDEFKSREDVFEQFRIVDDPKYQILYAGYECQDYEGSSVVFGYDHEKKQFFEVYASHCSCYGLEDQWDPEYYESFEELMQIYGRDDWRPGYARKILYGLVD
ncbi:hypothetical protein [Ralstonia phage RSF1]|uniref:Uncharacterized protein n=1 Tax=Ralstonia phage RSF1 TaxID=1689679 RepID=A0A0K2QR18_9CAUD|nr:hypothetical protein AVU11_gp206 [Ralstonia phage RSF1]BAS04998.1 hypothetical protein [Ralstonia phage RSF1]